MNEQDILRMAHLAGYIGSYADNGRGEQRFDFSKEQLIEFAKLVAAHEREACAYECEVRDGTFALKNAGKFFADIIRARFADIIRK